MRAIALFVAFCLTASAARAESCPEHFMAGEPPRLVSKDAVEDPPSLVLLCFRSFAVLHSSQMKQPLYAAQHLTAVELKRVPSHRPQDAFHEEPRLRRADRAWNRDYARDRYDRGHLAPSGDMRDAKAQRESFSLANIVPQEANLNRGAWAEIEQEVRRMALRRGELYVITGPVFDRTAAWHGQRVRVPIALFKIVFDPKTAEAGAYWAVNGKPITIRAVSVANVEAETGFRFFAEPVAKQLELALPRGIRKPSARH